MKKALIIALFGSLMACSTPPTSPTPPTETTSPALPAPKPSTPAGSISDIDKLSGQSACAAYRWKDRSKAPQGFIKGVARVYARQVCKYKSPQTTAAGVAGQAPGASEKDALAHYGLTGATGIDRLRETFTLLLGLGMRESSGNYGEGYDRSAGPETASEAEAGAFQFSFNSISASPALRSLYTEYQVGQSSCLLSVFREGADGDGQRLVGTGSGADFQAFTKKCPAFQTEYAAVLIRTLRKHFGPLNRKEAEVRSECREMLRSIEPLTDASGCKEFL